MEKYKPIGQRALYHLSEVFHELLVGCGKTYADNLRPFGVESARLTREGGYDRDTRTLTVQLRLEMSNGLTRIRSWPVYLGETAPYAGNTFLRSYCSATDWEIAALNDRLASGEELVTLEPELAKALAEQCALYTLPNEENGVSWTGRDREQVLRLFNL